MLFLILLRIPYQTRKRERELQPLDGSGHILQVVVATKPERKGREKESCAEITRTLGFTEKIVTLVKAFYSISHCKTIISVNRKLRRKLEQITHFLSHHRGRSRHFADSSNDRNEVMSREMTVRDTAEKH